MEEKTLKSRKVYKGKIINLRVDEVLLPRGGRARREVVEHPGSVAMVPLLPDNKVILIRQFRKPVEKVIFEIPAGRLEPGEKMEACVRRELKEEIGYRAGRLEKLVDYYPTPGYSNEVIHIFKVKGLKKVKQDLDFDEMVEVVTMDLDEAISLIRERKIKDGKTIIGLLLTAC